MYLRDWFVVTLVVAILIPVLMPFLSPAAIFFEPGFPLSTILARFWLRINVITTCTIAATLSVIVAWVIWPMGASRTNKPHPQSGSPPDGAGTDGAGNGKMIN